jgi:hypothetical protein
MAKFAPLAMEQQQITQAAAPLDMGGAAQPAGDQLSRLEAGVAKVETGGEKNPYSAKGPVTKSGDRAYGKYQVMGENIPSWTKEVLGREMTPQEFLADPDAQEKVARAKLGGYLQKYGDAPDAASMWFTGKPLAQGANKTDINGMTGARYAAAATGSMNDATPRIPVSAAGGSALTRGGDVGAAGVGVRGGRPGSIAAMINLFEPDPNKAPAIAGRFAKSLGIDQNADLTPELAQQAQKRIGDWAQRTGRQPAQGGGGQQVAQGPAEAPSKRLKPQVPLPFGLKPGQEEQAISGLNKQIESLSANPYAGKRIQDLEHQRDRIEQSIEPVDIAGERYAPTGEKLTHRMGTSPQSIAFENFMAEGEARGRPRTSEEQIQFLQRERPPRNPTAMIMDQARQEAEAQNKPFGVKEMRAVQRDLIAGNRGASSLAVTAAQLDRVEEESKSLIPRLEAILPQLDHKKFKTINGAIDAYSDQVGDPTYLKYKLQVEALAALWARTKKGNTPTGGETEEARHEIDSRWSKGGMQAVLDQYKVELQTMQEGTGRALQKWGVSLDDAAEIGKDLSADKGAAQSGGGGWTTLPNGARIREKP